ncbi:hypothetical protein HDU84_002039 [Entophlyctis sp. JEL0112]|nr:hypothetical protein HDU84_002039 [Entophlyctis sp. JEL0112]
MTRKHFVQNLLKGDACVFRGVTTGRGIDDDNGFDSSISFLMTKSGLLNRYSRLGLRNDARQVAALWSLDRLALAWKEDAKPTFKNDKCSRYIVGNVGSGKTMIMDIFAQEVNSKRTGIVQRFHFLEFMAHVFSEIHHIQTHAASEDPFKILSSKILSKSPVLCLDEFQLVDIGDAMVIRRLFTNLFGLGEPQFTLVTTSNKQISDLYATGLNRALVMPLLELLEHHCETVDLKSEFDYRKLHPQADKLRTLYHPSNPKSETPFLTQNDAHDAFMDRFKSECGDEVAERLNFKLSNTSRTIEIFGVPGRCAFLDFDVLCGHTGKLSSSDFTCIVNEFDVVFVSRLYRLEIDSADTRGVKDVDLGRRFINFIDVAYDAGVRVVIESEGSAHDVLKGLFPSPSNFKPSTDGISTTVLNSGGASSSSATTYVGMMEWSATGLQDASLAKIGGVGVSETGFAVERALSRLSEMGTTAFKSRARIRRKI